MKSIAILGVLAFVLVGTASGATADERTGKTAPDSTHGLRITKAKTKQQHKAVQQHKISPLRLPNINALVKRLWKADRSILAAQQHKSATVLAFFDGHGKWLLATRHKKCVEVPWQRSCRAARATVRLHTALERVATRRLDLEIPLINDWRTAVRWVQRIYPGTESWMLAISDREGGWGQWVWYGGSHWHGYHIGNDFLGADTVGGWMQFRYSTFEPYWNQTQRDLKQRGYIIPYIPMPPEGGPSKYAAWLSPLGQALTAGFMRYTGKDGCHWCL